MQSAPPIWLLAIALLAGGGLLCAPQEQTDRLQAVVRDALRPGQIAVQNSIDWCERQQPYLTSRWRGTSSTPLPTVSRDAFEERLQRLQAENASLREQLRRRSSSANSRFQTTEPLFAPDLVEARVLGEESLQRFQSQARKLLAAGEQNGIDPASLVIASKSSQVDLGSDSGMQADQIVLAGRAVVGRISQVGKLTSTLLPVTDARYRGLARLARPMGAGFDFGPEGILEGDGTDTCRLNFIQSTEAVSPGDQIYTAAADGGQLVPLLYGTVVQADLPAGAPHWNIRVKPASQGMTLRTVHIIRTKLNPTRLNAH